MAKNMTQTVLQQVLSLYHTHKEQLTPTEVEIAERIVACSLCDYLWVTRKKRRPERCPHCHRRAWDRPLLEAIRMRDVATQTKLTKQEDQHA